MAKREAAKKDRDHYKTKNCVVKTLISKYYKISKNKLFPLYLPIKCQLCAFRTAMKFFTRKLEYFKQ